MFDSETTFCEIEFIEKYKNLIFRDVVDIPIKKVLTVEEASKSDNKNINQNVESCLPGNPLIVLTF